MKARKIRTGILDKLGEVITILVSRVPRSTGKVPRGHPETQRFANRKLPFTSQCEDRSAYGLGRRPTARRASSPRLREADQSSQWAAGDGRRSRSSVINQIRGFLLERGITLRKGRCHLEARLLGFWKSGTRHHEV